MENNWPWKICTVIFLLVILTGSCLYDVQASSRLDVGIDMNSSVRFSLFSHDALLQSNEPWYEFDFMDSNNEYIEKIDVKVINPQEFYSETVFWQLDSNDSEISLLFRSIGYDGDDYISITDVPLQNFIKYTLRDNISYEESFSPGKTAANPLLLETGFLDGTITIEYNPQETENRWCCVEAGKYRDIIEVIIAGDYQVPVQCPTAWAYGGAYGENHAVSFNKLSISRNWGWSNGPLHSSDGDYFYDLYAGAALNDLNKGELAGTVIVSFVNQEVIYETSGGFTISEVHLYIGNSHPTKVAPGQLGYKNDEIKNENSYIISFAADAFTAVDFNENIYIAAHAVVCRD